MNKTKFIVIAILLMSVVSLNAQTKIGHIDVQKLLPLMPGIDSVQAEIQGYVKDMQDAGELMQVEYNNKYEEFQQGQDTFSEPIKKMKGEELMQLQQRVQAFQQSAQADIQQKEGELFQPLQERMFKAIEEVGKANGFTYIMTEQVMLFKSPDAIDVLPLVKKQLGIAVE